MRSLELPLQGLAFPALHLLHGAPHRLRALRLPHGPPATRRPPRRVPGGLPTRPAGGGPLRRPRGPPARARSCEEGRQAQLRQQVRQSLRDVFEVRLPELDQPFPEGLRPARLDGGRPAPREGDDGNAQEERSRHHREAERHLKAPRHPYTCSTKARPRAVPSFLASASSTQERSSCGMLSRVPGQAWPSTWSKNPTAPTTFTAVLVSSSRVS